MLVFFEDLWKPACTQAVCYFVHCYSQFPYRRCWFFFFFFFSHMCCSNLFQLCWHDTAFCGASGKQLIEMSFFFIKTLVQEINYFVWKLQQSAQNYLVRLNHWLVQGNFNPLSRWICDDAVCFFYYYYFVAPFFQLALW